jgi:hypothetical protein
MVNYSKFIDNMNAVIKKYSDALARRRGVNKKKAESGKSKVESENEY